MSDDRQGLDPQHRHALMEENRRAEAEMLREVRTLRDNTAKARERLLQDELRLRRRGGG